MIDSVEIELKIRTAQGYQRAQKAKTITFLFAFGDKALIVLQQKKIRLRDRIFSICQSANFTLL